MSSGSRMRAAAGILLAVIATIGAVRWYQHEHRPQVTLIRVPIPEDSDSTRASTAEDTSTLRVCADPNNLPFSNARGEGFENRLAELIAADLGRTVSYTWWPQRRGFIRHTLRAKLCDLVMGVPTRFEQVETTRPYYRSSYVFVTRQADALDLASLDDPRLRALRIGLHAIGDDYSNVPPAQALAERGLAANVRGYSIYGDYSQPDPPRALIDALAKGEIDVAIAWGPIGGFFASREGVPLAVTTLAGSKDALVPSSFAISLGVRHGEKKFLEQIETALARHRHEISALLDSYGVPLVDAPQDKLVSWRSEE